jgi:replicative DNA helicase
MPSETKGGGRLNLELEMPANLDCERAVLGAILLDNSAYDQAAARITAEAFSLDSHRRIYLRMQELFEEGIPIDFNTLTEQLGKKKEIESVGGVVYVSGLTDGLPRVKNISHHCDILLDKFISRQIIHASNAAIAAAYEQSDSGKRCLDYLLENLLALQSNGCKEFAVTPNEFSGQVMANMIAMREKHSRLIGFSLALDGVNHKTTGVRKKELCVIGGRPGQGKTSWALQIAIENCLLGTACAFFSLEMDKESLLQRVYSCHGQIDFTRIRVPFLLQDVDTYALGQIKTEIDSWPLYIDDDSSGETGLTLPELCSRIRLLKRQKGVRLFIIDYLQLIATTGKDPREKVMRIVRRLRRLAKSEDIAIILLSQMPRPKDHGTNKKPTMFDLLESGEIEQAAHLIMLPWWPSDEAGVIAHEKFIVIAKQRNGETWDEPVEYIGKFQRYESR